MANCPKCGTENAQGMKFCGECGSPLPQTKKCPQCGMEWSANAKFCGECGYNFAGTNVHPTGGVNVNDSVANNGAGTKVSLQCTLERYMAARDFPKNMPHISKEEFSVIEQAAKNNEDGRALLIMGDCYFMGDAYFHRDGNGVVSQDLDQAMYWYDLAVSEWGVPEAKKMRMDYRKVLTRIERAFADMPDLSDGEFRDQIWGTDLDEFFAPVEVTPLLVYILITLSVQGNNIAKMGLARLLYVGGGEVVADLGYDCAKIGQDDIDLVKDAAEHGLPIAAYFLGTESMEWYFNLSKDERKDWLTRAAEQGFESAKRELGN